MNMAVPLADSIFLELVLLKSVCGLDLHTLASAQHANMHSCVDLLLGDVLVAESAELLCSRRLDRVARGDILLRAARH
jgi:hypothetical protein